MEEFTTKDSGSKDEFDSGYQRDSGSGKTRFDLIPYGPLERVANLYARGAEKYGDNNWTLGAPYSRTYASLFRHLIQWRQGDRSEDHGAAVIWNMMALMHYEDNNPELNDLEYYNKHGNTGEHS